MKSRYLKSIVAVAALTSLFGLSACAGTGGAAAPAASGDSKTLEVWHAYAGQPDKVEFINWALDGFKKKYPDIKVKEVAAEQSSYKTKLQTAMSTGHAPDVFYTLPGGFLKAFVDSGQVMNLDDALATDGWGDSFIPSAMSSVSFDGSAYAAPIDIDAAAIWYDKALFAKKGWTVPKTWDEFLTLSDTIAKDGIVPVALGNKDSWPATFWFQYAEMRQQGSGVVTDFVNKKADATFGPNASDAANVLKTLADKKYLPTGANGMSDQEANILFLNGKAAMVLNGTWQIGMSADAPAGFDLGYFPFPSMKGGAGDQTDVLAGVAAAFAASKKPADKEAAVNFLKYMTSPDVMKQYVKIRKTMVTLKGATTPDIAGPVLSGVVTDLIEKAGHLDAFYDTALPPKATTTYYTTLQGLVDGSVSADDAASAIQTAVKAGQ